jgi:tRNA-binding protein
MISWDYFNKVEMRVGTVISVSEFPNARKPALKLTIDFGEVGVKQSSAQIADLYSVEDLLERQVIAVTNFPAKQIANFMSECLVLGVVQLDGKAVLLEPERKVPDGLRVA